MSGFAAPLSPGLSSLRSHGVECAYSYYLVAIAFPQPDVAENIA